MTFTLGVVGAGQFAGQFAELFMHHPSVSRVFVTDLIAERATDLMRASSLAGVHESFDAMLADPAVDAVAAPFLSTGRLACLRMVSCVLFVGTDPSPASTRGVLYAVGYCG